MNDEALLKELTELENTVRFDSFDFNDAYSLGSALRAAGGEGSQADCGAYCAGWHDFVSVLSAGHRRHQQQLDGQEAAHCALTGTTSLRAAVGQGCTAPRPLAA